MARLVALVLLGSALAGCGGGRNVASPVPATTATTATTPAPRSGAGHAQDARLLRDVRLIHAAALRAPASTLHGTPALRRATGRFLEDLDRSPDVERLRKNRLIDHAAGALGGTCGQCFQQLEAVRPIITR